MKNNVIAPSHQVPIQNTGTLAIIGMRGSRVVFMASGINTYGAEDLDNFAENSICTGDIEGRGDILIFEHRLRSKLRNPQKLLKSVRNKLVRAINAACSAFEDEMNQLDHEVSMAIHHPYGHRYTDALGLVDQEEDLGPLPKVCYY